MGRSTVRWRWSWRSCAALVAAIVASACVISRAAPDVGRSDASVKAVAAAEALDAAARSGGEGTVFVTNRHAFAKSLTTLPVTRLRDFAFGNRLFNTNWVEAPASVESLDGLGPVFNRVSCSACHTRDGRGQPPAGPDDPMMSMLARLSVPPTGAYGQPRPHPVYGGQISDRAIGGVPPEGRVTVTWQEVPGGYGDGTPYTLRRPVYEVVDLNFGPLGEETVVSPRVASAVYGLGLLEAVEAQTIRALADPNDADGDGISGRVNEVWDPVAGRLMLGRFNWKAAAATLRQQAADASAGDMGITTSLTPHEDYGEGQTAAAAAIAGGIDPATGESGPELSDEHFDKLEFYLRTLAVPARRDVDDPVVRRGEELFGAIGCAACHVPTLRTGSVAAVEQLANQTIHPYTDMLLHDMGEDLADGRAEFKATGSEWRTPPLWGIGLIPVVNDHFFLLHDGRARGVAEAILWHGGEALRSREAFRNLPAEDRAALIRFLESL